MFYTWDMPTVSARQIRSSSPILIMLMRAAVNITAVQYLKAALSTHAATYSCQWAESTQGDVTTLNDSRICYLGAARVNCSIGL